MLTSLGNQFTFPRGNPKRWAWLPGWLCLAWLAVPVVGQTPNRSITIAPVEVTECAPVFANLPVPLAGPAAATRLPSDPARGGLLYRTTLPAGPVGTLEATAIRELGLVFLNGERVGALGRHTRGATVSLPERKVALTLDVLVEAAGAGDLGAVGFTTGPTKTNLQDWQVYRLPVDGAALAGLKYGSRVWHTPAYWRVRVEVAEPGDTFLDLHSWGKGMVWVNGQWLGHFWNVGPAQTLRVPGAWLQRGANEIVILDLLGPEQPVVAGLAQPLLDQLRPEQDFTRQRSASRLRLKSGRLAHAGEFAAGPDWQEIKFQEAVTGRYFCLDALSARDDRPYAAVAELTLLDAAGQPLNSAGWTVAYVDSEEHEREDGAAENILDGQPATHWHTQWSEASPPFQHRLILDLGRAQTISGFRYLPRQGPAEVTGRIKEYEITIGDRLTEDRSPAELLPEKCFLFSYFTDEDTEGLHLAWSVDGFRWEELNHGRSVFKPDLSEPNLMRDPCLLRGPDGTFQLVWTTDWKGRTIGYATSKDLLHWSVPRALPVMADEPDTLNCWAPEIIWDAAREQYQIYWTSAIKGRFGENLGPVEEQSNQRVYFTTTQDFQTFAPTKLMYDPGFGLIDATLLAADGQEYLFFKDETSQPPMKNLRLAEGHDPQGPFGPPAGAFSPSWVEGPTVFLAGSEFVALYHFYGNNHWGAMQSKDLKRWQDATDRLVMPPRSHPGTVLKMSRDTLLALWRAGRADIGPAIETVELGLGDWIWTDTVQEKQTCRLWRAFNVPAGTLVSQARLRITADNGYRVLLDGRELGRGGDFNSLTEYDLTRVMSPGAHVLAVEGFNDAANAGVILGLVLEMSNGEKIEVLSDCSWRVVPMDEKNWATRPQARESWPPASRVAFAGKYGWRLPARIINSPPVFPLTTRFWQQGWFLLVLLAACVVVGAFSIRQGLQLTVQTRSHRLLERERARIARDIHDDLGAGLTQLTLQGELIRRETPPEARTHGQVEALCERARTLLGSLDEVVWAVNPRRDTVQDFATFVCEHAQSYLGSTAIRSRLEVADDLPATPLDLPARRNLLLAVKEAVRNAARHSGGDEVSLAVRVQEQQLVVVVGDNGRGFALEKSSAGRNGLRNMQERLADVGGVCQMATLPGKGCRVTFILPLNAPRREAGWLTRMRRKLFGVTPERKP